MTYYIYILECANGAYYTGYTTDITRRFQEHAQGTNKCKYTRSFPPHGIAACWELSLELSIILKIEKLIKTLLKKEKLALISDPALFLSILANSGYELTVIDNIRYCPAYVNQSF